MDKGRNKVIQSVPQDRFSEVKGGETEEVPMRLGCGVLESVCERVVGVSRRRRYSCSFPDSNF